MGTVAIASPEFFRYRIDVIDVQVNQSPGLPDLGVASIEQGTAGARAAERRARPAPLAHSRDLDDSPEALSLFAGTSTAPTIPSARRGLW